MHINKWIVHAVKYNAQKVKITITQFHSSAYEIPHCLLNCKSLKRLAVLVYGKGIYADIILPRSMSLPQLKELYLCGLYISDVESTKRLFSSCPVLETFGISSCDIQTDNQRNFIVDSVSLKKFDCTCQLRHLLPQNDTTASIIKLCAPNLEDFTFTSLFVHDYFLENYSPLSSVSLNFKLTAKRDDETAETYLKLSSLEKLVYADRMMKFLAAVYKVKNLRLSSGLLEVLSQALGVSDCQPPRLSNLEHLKLDMWFTRGCLRSVAYLLSISPNLSSISLTLKQPNLGNVEDNWRAGLSLPAGMLSRLELVQIKEVEGCENEVKFLSFLLRNAKVLKKVVLYPRSTIGLPDRVRKQFRDKLRALKRVSPRILMHWPATKSTHVI